MAMQLNPSEISELIRARIKDFDVDFKAFIFDTILSNIPRCFKTPFTFTEMERHQSLFDEFASMINHFYLSIRCQYP